MQSPSRSANRVARIAVGRNATAHSTCSVHQKRETIFYFVYLRAILSRNKCYLGYGHTCQNLNKNSKALKIHSVILLSNLRFVQQKKQQQLHLNGRFWSNALDMHYSCSAGRNQSESTFCFRIHVTSGFNVFSNRHFNRKLVTQNSELQSHT